MSGKAASGDAGSWCHGHPPTAVIRCFDSNDRVSLTLPRPARPSSALPAPVVVTSLRPEKRIILVRRPHVVVVDRESPSCTGWPKKTAPINNTYYVCVSFKTLHMQEKKTDS